MNNNLDVVRGVYQAFAVGDIPSVLGALSPTVRWTEVAGGPYGGVSSQNRFAVRLNSGVWPHISRHCVLRRKTSITGGNMVIAAQHSSALRVADVRTLIPRIALTLLGLLVAPVQAQTLMVWGDNASSQVSGAPSGDLKAVSGGAINGIALRWDGTPVLWGIGPIGPPAIPDALATETFYAVSLGRDDAVLIRSDGTLAAFGRNAPITNVPAGSYNAVAVGSVHAVAIADDGTLTTWGWDSWPPPSGSRTGLLNAPAGGPFKEIDARVLYSLALHEDGTLYGWGHAAQGTNVLAGWPATPEDSKIFYIPDQNFKAIAAGNVHALAIRPNGTITGWGNGTGGALQPPTDVRFKAVAAGWGFSIGLSTDGTLWGWGTPIKSPFSAQAWTFASEGWTRYGETQHYYIPNERFKAIAAAGFHVMAITAGRGPGR